MSHCAVKRKQMVQTNVWLGRTENSVLFFLVHMQESGKHRVKNGQGVVSKSQLGLRGAGSKELCSC